MQFPTTGQYTSEGNNRPRGISVGFGHLCSSTNKSLCLQEVLAANGLAEFVSAFVEQGVGDMESAMSLSLEEVRTVLNSQSKAATVGAVRSCHRILTEVANTTVVWGSESQRHLLKAVPTPQSVLSRSLLHLSPHELKGALNARVNAESIFASLMLTVAAAALMETPDPEDCNVELGLRNCDGLRCGYLIAWGMASAGFSMACLVSLGSMQLFFGHASDCDVHDRFIGSEAYLNLSHNFISVGLVLGLLPGLCINMFLRFPQYCRACGFVSSFLWLLWMLQFWRGMESVRNIYGEFPGFGTISQFLRGYVPWGRTIVLAPRQEPKEKKSVRFSSYSTESLYCKAQQGPTDIEAQTLSEHILVPISKTQSFSL